MNIGTHFFLNHVDMCTRENILNLDQKLKTLREEIEIKLPKVKQTSMNHLMNEVDEAIKALRHVVSLVSNDNEEARKEFLQMQAP